MKNYKKQTYKIGSKRKNFKHLNAIIPFNKPKKDTSRPDNFTCDFCQTCQGKIILSHKLLQSSTT